MKLARKQHHERDATRRWTRRGVARAVLEHKGNDAYMETHPIAAEMANTYGTSKIERLASERNPAGSSSSAVMSVGCPGCDLVGPDHIWPCKA
jgi:hypothetical protein